MPAGTDGADGRFPWRDLATRARRVVWLWPALLTLVVGLYEVTRPELWRDELSSWSFASRPVPELVMIVHHSDASQLGYYLVLHYWIAAFGDSVFAMRLLSVLAMAVAAACVTLIGRRLADQRAGLLAGLVFALVPSVSRFAQEARFYALEVLVAMIATLALLRAMDRPDPRRWALYGASMALLGYLDLVALCLLAAHAAGVVLRWRTDRDEPAKNEPAKNEPADNEPADNEPADNEPAKNEPGRKWMLLGFGLAAVGACAATLPIALIGLGQVGRQLVWLTRPALTLNEFSFFGRNLFYSTSAAAALIIVAVFAWAVAWRAAAFATAIAVLPVAVVWVVSQGPYSYFFPRYLLLTIGAWALLAGIALSRVDLRVAAAGVLVFGILGFGDQQAIRTLGAHNWTAYPLNLSMDYPDFAGAARYIAKHANPGDGIAYPGNPVRWMMIDYGVEYYLTRDMPTREPPRELFVAETAAKAGTLYPLLCLDSATCLGHTTRMWIVDTGRTTDPYAHLPADESMVLRADHFSVLRTRHLEGLTVFLMLRPAPATRVLPGTSTTAVMIPKKI
jgi:mannosyltransferase